MNEDKDSNGGGGEDCESLSSKFPRGLRGEKVMILLNTTTNIDRATTALNQAGILTGTGSAIPYHANMLLEERTSNLDRLRRYRARGDCGGTASTTPTNNDNDDDAGAAVCPEIMVVCTNLESLGLDVPGVLALVNLQFAGNLASHLHHMERCSHVGNINSRGAIYYLEFGEGELIGVVMDEERRQERYVLDQDVNLELEAENSDDKEREEGGRVRKPKGGVNVGAAFSRKRGITKKRKKEWRERREKAEAEEEEEET